ncbi:hypothetical protein [Actinoplanes sp. URMC 104]|uniref:hypothetical protein n=1 Tax=Actinoplanes sp. URMC 104 TaxID=3423409 RepID=UPI003F1CB6F9
MLIGALLALVTLVAAGGITYAAYGRDDPAPRAAPASPSPSTVPSTAAAGPADEQCTPKIKSNRRWVCLTSAVVADGKLTIDYQVDYDGSTPDADEGFHLHIWGAEGAGEEHLMGAQADEGVRGAYYTETRRPSVLDVDGSRFRRTIGDAPKVCARIARAGHELVRDADGGYRTGNCVPIERR